MSQRRWEYRDGISVDCIFAGGNIMVESRDGDTIYLHQDLRDTEGDWFYWYFRVSGAAGKTLCFEFTGSDVAGPRGPATSIDGRDWRWFGHDYQPGSNSFTFTFPVDCSEVRFAMAIPYVHADLVKFLVGYDRESRVNVEDYYQSASGRDFEVIRIDNPDAGRRRYRVLLTARNHACESIASYVLEGIVNAALGISAVGDWFNENVEILAFPIVDLDGVERGDQGKNRSPHDHNRDYGRGDPIYPEIRSLKRLVENWATDGVSLGIDLHCPYIRGKEHERIFFVGGSNASVFNELTNFSKILEKVQGSGLGYSAGDILPYGESWNTADSGVLESCSAWMTTLPGIKFAATLETAYANANGNEVTVTSARNFGADIARAIHEYLE
jgi:hypothetical protein